MVRLLSSTLDVIVISAIIIVGLMAILLGVLVYAYAAFIGLSALNKLMILLGLAATAIVEFFSARKLSRRISYLRSRESREEA